MKYCSNCHLGVQDDIQSCPLCHKVLDVMPDEEENRYAGLDHSMGTYPDARLRHRRIRFILRVILLIFIFAAVAAAFVNHYVSPHVKWAWIAIAALVYIYFFLWFWVRNDTPVIGKVGLMLVVTMALLLIIDHFTGAHGWALRYAVPGLILLGDGIIFLFMIISKDAWYSYLLTLFLFAVCSIVVVIAYLILGRENITLPMICLGVSILYLLATYILRPREFGREFRRRFHV